MTKTNLLSAAGRDQAPVAHLTQLPPVRRAVDSRRPQSQKPHRPSQQGEHWYIHHSPHSHIHPSLVAKSLTHFMMTGRSPRQTLPHGQREAAQEEENGVPQSYESARVEPGPHLHRSFAQTEQLHP